MEDATGATGPSPIQESTGATGPVSIDEHNPMIIASTFSEPLPDIIAVNDLLNDIQVLTAKETADRALVETIGSLTTFQVRPKLVEWALGGFKTGYEIHSITITSPQVCVDGVSRDLRQYIEYLIGKTLDDYIDTLNPKFIDMNIEYAYFGNRIAILVSKV
jgi:hypothetical protein